VGAHSRRSYLVDLPGYGKSTRPKEMDQPAAYEQTLVALSACIDPIAHDPWPNHWTASGASYGVTLDANRAIGGLPCPAIGP
jgi:hypothetical protein